MHGCSVATLATLALLDNGMVQLLAMLCLVMLSVAMLRRSQQHSATRRDLTREQLARLRDQKQIRDSLDDLLAQIEEVTRRVNAQLDTKFVKLETILRDADDRIAQLRKLQRRNAESARPAAETTADTTPSDDEFQPGLPGWSACPSPSTPPPGETGPLPADRAQRFRRIYDLADAGTPAIAIADALQIPLAEIELILGLRKLK